MRMVFKYFRLTFAFNPSSSVYGFENIELKPDGENIDVTLDNIEEYVELVTDLCLRSGIQRQMEAFRSGFNRVFPMEKLFPFSPSELQTILCGDQAPQWSREDILNYTEPKLGYTRERYVDSVNHAVIVIYQMLLNLNVIVTYVCFLVALASSDL